jgi:histidine ammonia-lyase
LRTRYAGKDQAVTGTFTGTSTATPVQIDGTGLTCTQVRLVARDGRQVRVHPDGLERAQRAREVIQRIAAVQPVYGRTTGVGANRAVPVDDTGHGLRLLRSHAGGAGPVLDPARARAMLVVRLNQLAAGGSGVEPALLGVLAEALNQGLAPLARMTGSIGTGDLPALASAALCILGERPWQGGTMPAFAMDPADALAFMSSNAATIGEAALACAELGELLDAAIVVAALSFLAVSGSPEAYALAVQEARPHPGQGAVAARLRALLAGQPVKAARIQDPYGYRALPQVHGPAADAVAALDRVLCTELNSAAENPLVDAAAGEVLHNGNFYTASLGLALDAARASLFQTAALSAARLGTLMEPAFTGLRPFLGDEEAASSGVMMLEYVAHSALADIRRLASPAALGSAVLSRGLEEQANFSTQAARAATDTVTSYRIVLSCELVAAVRALGLRGTAPAPGPLACAYELAASALDPRVEDRPLDPDIEVADRLLSDLAALLRPGRPVTPGPACYGRAGLLRPGRPVTPGPACYARAGLLRPGRPAGGRGGRGALAQARLLQDPAVPGVAVDGFEHELDRARDDLADVPVHGGEARGEQARHRVVVVADDGQVAGDGHAQGAGRSVGAVGDRVGEAEQRRGAVGLTEDRLGDFGGVAQWLARGDDAHLEGQPLGLRADVQLGRAVRGARPGRGEHGDLPVAEGLQVLERQADTGLVVEQHLARGAAAVQRVADGHDGQALAERGPVLRGRVERLDDQAVHPLVPELAGQHLLAARVAAGADEQGIPVAGEQFAADPDAEQLLPQVLEGAAEQADHAGPAAGQGAGDGIGLVTQLGGGLPDPLLSLVGGLHAAQGIRHGGRG